MSWPEALRVSLEAATAANLTLFAAFLVARRDWRTNHGFYLLAFCIGFAFLLVVNNVTSAGAPPAARLANYVVELTLGPLLFGLCSRAALEGPPLRRPAVFFAVVPAAALGVLTFAPGAADAVAILSLIGFLTLSWAVLFRRRGDLKASGLFAVVLSATLLISAAAAMRIWMTVAAQSGSNYREGAPYLLLLAAGAAFAARLLWSALFNPKAHRARRRIAPKATEDRLEHAFVALIDSERLFLEPEARLGDIAARLAVPQRRVSELLRDSFGENLAAYMNRRRSELAAEMLRATDLPVTTILYDSGFGSKSAFHREFTRRYLMSPSEYRRRFRVPSASAAGQDPRPPAS